jgi:hypothetical protein
VEEREAGATPFLSHMTSPREASSHEGSRAQYENAWPLPTSRADQAAAQRDSSQVHPTVLFLLAYEGELV